VGGACTTHKGIGKYSKSLIGKSPRITIRGGPRHRWKDIMEIYIEEIVSYGGWAWG
jgi:hypothetical protein